MLKRGVKKDEAEIEKAVNELMLRCSGDVSLLNIAVAMGMMTGGVSIQEVDLSAFRPEFTQFRFLVDDDGRLSVEKVYIVQRKSPETGQTEYAQFTSKIQLEIGKDLQQPWTESVQTEPYGVALAKEVEEESKKTNFKTAFEKKKEELHACIKDPEDRKRVIGDMEKYFIEKGLLSKAPTK